MDLENESDSDQSWLDKMNLENESDSDQSWLDQLQLANELDSSTSYFDEQSCSNNTTRLETGIIESKLDPDSEVRPSQVCFNGETRNKRTTSGRGAGSKLGSVRGAYKKREPEIGAGSKLGSVTVRGAYKKREPENSRAGIKRGGYNKRAKVASGDVQQTTAQKVATKFKDNLSFLTCACCPFAGPQHLFLSIENKSSGFYIQWR